MGAKKSRGPRFGKFLVVGIAVAVLILAGAIYGGYQLYVDAFPSVATLKSSFPRVIYRGKNEPPVVNLTKSRPPGWRTLGSISAPAIGAVIVSEDWAFYSHRGYDANQIREVIEQSMGEGRLVRGASTITQQVAKNVFLSRDKTLWRKFRELILAMRLEKELGKKKILEIYLNIAEWGPGIFGIQQAAQYYFQKSAGELTAKEGAFLAVLLPSPIRYGQSFRKKQLTPYAASTIRSILRKMVQAGFLSEEERELAQRTALSFEEHAAPILTEGEGPADEAADDAPDGASTESAPGPGTGKETFEPPLPETLFEDPEPQGEENPGT